VEIQKILSKVRSTVKQALPVSKETISYNMPAFMVDDKIVVYFAACKAHIGMYPPVRGVAALKRAAAPYAGPKGNLQLPYSKPIPYDLIARIARSRATATRMGTSTSTGKNSCSGAMPRPSRSAKSSRRHNS